MITLVSLVDEVEAYSQNGEFGLWEDAVPILSGNVLPAREVEASYRRFFHLNWTFSEARWLTANMRGQIFISYRRDDSSAWAGHLHGNLIRSFDPDQIFIDLDNLDAGIVV